MGKKKKKVCKMLPSQLRDKIRRLERKVKNEKVLTTKALEKIETLRRQLRTQGETIEQQRKEADERRDAHLKSLGEWSKDSEELREARITISRMRERLHESGAQRQVCLALAQAHPHNYLIARQTFDMVHKGQGMATEDILVTVSNMQANYAFLFRSIQ